MNITTASFVLLFHDLVMKQLEHFTVKQSFLQCAQYCVHEYRCRSVFYHEEMKQCLPHEAVLSRRDARLVRHHGYKCFKSDLIYEPQTCVDVKEANPEARDGEYNIYPTAKQFHGRAAGIYCVMRVDPPEEYVTLNGRNYGIFPNRQSRLWGCSVGGKYVSGNDIKRKTGRTNFKKVRVLPKTMAIVRGDTRFCETRRENACLYGKSEDCYSKNCGSLGVFNSNLKDTGMKLNKHLQWQKFGDHAHDPDVKWYLNDSEVTVKCGGKCGGCDVVGEMLLYPHP